MNKVKQGNWVVISLPQKLSLGEVQELSDIMDEATQEGHYRFIADAANMRVIDSYAIGFLTRRLHEVRDHGGDIGIRDLNGPPLEVFKQAGLDRLFMLKQGSVTYAASEDLFAPAKKEIKLQIAYEPKGEFGIICLVGMMSSKDDVREFKSKVLPLLAEKSKIVLDLGKFTYFGSAFTGQILSINRILKKSNGGIRICNASDFTRRLLIRLNIDKVIPIFDTFEQAVARWK